MLFPTCLIWISYIQYLGTKNTLPSIAVQSIPHLWPTKPRATPQHIWFIYHMCVLIDIQHWLAMRKLYKSTLSLGNTLSLLIFRFVRWCQQKNIKHSNMYSLSGTVKQTVLCMWLAYTYYNIYAVSRRRRRCFQNINSNTHTHFETDASFSCLLAK